MENQSETKASIDYFSIKRLQGSLISFVGFLLSPLSWWNDLILNIPLAYVFALCVSFFFRRLFLASFIGGYWLTNILGLIMLHHGAKTAVSGEHKPYTRKAFAFDMLFSLGYTALIVVLAKADSVTFPDYFSTYMR